MRILHVISDSNIGGAGVLLLNLLRWFDRKKVESVVGLPRGSRLRRAVLETKTQVVELDQACDRVSPASVLELLGVIRAVKPDLVHANAAISARLAGKLAGKKVIYTRHCTFPVEKKLPVVRFARNFWNNALCDCAIATARVAAVDLRETGIPRRKIVVIPNGCEPVREVLPGEIELFRAKYGISEEDFCVGICARLEPCKGHEIFLRAAKEAIDAMPEIPFRFLIVGEGSCRAELETLAKELKIADRVVFCGFLYDPAPIYRIMQIHVNCSVGTETSSLAVSEGFSAGLPTVLSDYGGNRDMLGESGAGICVSKGNPKALAEAICKLAGDDAFRAETSRKARKRYEQNYTAASMAKRLTAVYEGMLR
ncbi:MAG: glycosyltransferase [Ruminococcaceae bacterium]|nr:glycosyltransferase [Oscillospiraceae bacterium]